MILCFIIEPNILLNIKDIGVLKENLGSPFRRRLKKRSA